MKLQDLRTVCMLTIFATSLASSACANATIRSDLTTERSCSAQCNEEKSIFIFLDGTGNEEISSTNVFRLYRAIEENAGPSVSTLYITGVGAENKPLSGRALGRGMEERIVTAYDFVSRNFRPGDRIYIFGFSRGALQARSLAGLIAYVGILPSFQDSGRKIERVVEFLKEQTDDAMAGAWAEWGIGDEPPLANKAAELTNARPVAAEVEFLGAWDTVPGSSFKNYGTCKETRGFWKKNFWWLPIISRGDRYKIDSYPPIRQIAHAMSLDEKREDFAPIRVCPPQPSAASPTKIDEVWFAGAHSDVGGGYSDSDSGLSDISLDWMIELLSQSYTGPVQIELKPDPLGMSHWSVCDNVAVKNWNCVDRETGFCGSVKPKPALSVHDSVRVRLTNGEGSIRWNGQVTSVPYPVCCPKRCGEPPRP